MNRDGHMQSLWQSGMDDYQPQNSFQKDTVYDVLIVGGGITGLTTGLLLQQQGRKCIIAELHNIGFGTTGGTTAHLNKMLDTPYNIIESDFGEEGAKLLRQGTAQAIDKIESLVAELGIDCGFSRQTAYLYAQTDAEVKELEDIYTATEKAGCPVGWADTIPVPDSFLKAMRCEDEAQFHSTKYLYGLAGAYEAAGGVLLQHCKVEAAPHADGTFTADTTLGQIKAALLVYATHIPPGINILHFRCAPYRSYAAAFRLKEGIYPEGLAYDMKDPYHYFRTQEVDGAKYIIAGGYDHKTGHEPNTDQCFRELEAYLRHLYDIESIDYKWSSQYFNSPDGLPYIGLLPGHDNTYTGTGYGGNGMTLGTLAGIIISDMIVKGSSPYEELFRPSRIKPIAGFADFVKENMDVVSQFVGKRFAYEKVSTLADMAPGEGKLAEWEGKKVGLYKDEEGRIYGVDPVCPHAKCIVDWNSAERSWDCPCHGARYAPSGELLTGPARKGLEPIIWQGIEGD